MIKSVGERDFSSQETAHLLLSLPLYSCTYNFVTLSLDGGQLVITDNNTSDSATNPSTIDVYRHRTRYGTTLTSFNLLQFTANNSVTRDEPKKRTYPVIVKTFPNYSPDPKGPKYSLYCKYQLIKLKPWQNSPQNAWDNQPPCDDTYISAYHSFLQTEYAQKNVTDYSEDLEKAEAYFRSQENSDIEDNDYQYQSSTSQDEWMLLCQLNPTYQQETQQDNTDWEAAAKQLPEQLLRSCPTWISTKRALHEGTLSTRQFPQVDLNKLNVQQKKAYTIVSAHFSNNTDATPLRMMVLGTAGTGKSFLIRALAQLLGNACIISATTGIAAFHIGGITLHSALQLPVQSHNKTDLSGTSLATLQHKLKDVHYIIVDEVSMLGQRGMEWVDKRLRQATGKQDTPFGGISLILIGDFAQLPPVGGRALYINNMNSHGHTMYRLFTTVVFLTEMVRQQGSDHESMKFRELLLRLRNGCTTKEDWASLLT